VKNINVLLSDRHYWIELLLDMLKGLRGNAKLFPSWTQLQNSHLLTTCYQRVGALKSSASRRCRFTHKQKNYLTERFEQREQSGQKCDPASVARSMMSVVDSQGKRKFSGEEFLTVPQLAGFFSRLPAKKSLLNDDYLEEEIECATEEATIEELTNEVSRELLPGHSIMWDKYNLCEMTSGGKLDTTKLSVAKLRDICCGLDLAVDVSIKRKQPYAHKIEEYCQNFHRKEDK